MTLTRQCQWKVLGHLRKQIWDQWVDTTMGFSSMVGISSELGMLVLKVTQQATAELGFKLMPD